MGNGLLFWGLGGLLAVAGVALLAWAMFWDRAGKARKRCPKCWYDMTHQGESAASEPLRCPECGYRVRKEWQLRKTRRRWGCAVVALAIALGGMFLIALPTIRRDGWAALVPTTALVSGVRFSSLNWPILELERRMQVRSRGNQVAPSFMSDRMWRRLAANLANRLATMHAPDAQQDPMGTQYNNQLYTATMLLSQVPSPADEAALPSLYDAVLIRDRPSHCRGELCSQINRIVGDTNSPDIRRRHVRFVVEQLWRVPHPGYQIDLVKMLHHEWPEISDAVPTMEQILLQEDHRQVHSECLDALSGMGPFAADALDTVLSLLPKSAHDWDRILRIMRTLCAIDHGNEHAHTWLEEKLFRERLNGRATVQVTGVWVSCGFDTKDVITVWRQLIAQDPGLTRTVIYECQRVGNSKGAAAAFLLDIIEQVDTPDFIIQAHEALHAVGAFPDDVIHRLETLIAGDDRWASARARETLDFARSTKRKDE